MDQILNFTFLNDALKKNPRSTLFAILADELFTRGETQKAISILENGVAIFPNYASAFYLLGLCYKKINDEQKSRLAFERAYSLSPFNQNINKIFKEIIEIEEINFISFEDYYKQNSPTINKNEILSFDEYVKLHHGSVELDKLADTISQAPRIVSNEEEILEEIQTDENLENLIITPTFAEILVKQKQFDEAIIAFEILSKQNKKFLKRIEEIKILKADTKKPD